MKKVICIFLAFAMIFAVVPSVFAANEVEFTVSSDESNYYTVSGTVNSTLLNIPLTLMVTDEDGKFVCGFQTVADTLQDGKAYFSFEPFQFPSSVLSGKYYFTISGRYVTTTSPKEEVFNGPDKLFGLLKNIQEAIAEKNTEKLINAFLADTDGTLIKDLSQLKALAVDGRSLFGTVMQKITITLPDGYETDEQKEQITQQRDIVQNQYRDAIAIGSFADISNQNQFTAWDTEYFSKYHLGEDDSATAQDESRMVSYYNEIKTDADFLNRIYSLNTLTTFSEIQQGLLQNALLSCIIVQYQSKTREIIDAFPSLFPVNRDKFTQLSLTKQGEVYTTLANQEYTSCADLTAKFDALVLQMLANSGSNPGTGTGNQGTTGGGGSWGTTGGGGVTLPNDDGKDDDVTPPVVEPAFSDLEEAAWAKEAITYLNEQGIVSGKSDKIFAPNDSITRAEFVKILVQATYTKVDNSADSGFIDVAPNAWYSPYIAAAKNAGLVMGNDSNAFCPDDTITREDMAVLLYRAYQVESSNSLSLPFADKDAVSEYAVSAVAYFYENGIIMGIGQNLFGPKDSATRAQAAQMIYNIIK